MIEGRGGGGGGDDPTMTHVLILEGNRPPPNPKSLCLCLNKYNASCVFKLLKLVKTTMCLIGNIETPQAALLPF